MGSCVQLLSLAETPELHPPRGSYARALLVSQDRRHLLAPPFFQPIFPFLTSSSTHISTPPFIHPIHPAFSSQTSTLLSTFPSLTSHSTPSSTPTFSLLFLIFPSIQSLPTFSVRCYITVDFRTAASQNEFST